MKRTLWVLGFVICMRVTLNSIAALAAGTGEQDFAEGERLLKNKQYAEARTALESRDDEEPLECAGAFQPGRTLPRLKSWACAEEHYETALYLDAKSRPRLERWNHGYEK